MRPGTSRRKTIDMREFLGKARSVSEAENSDICRQGPHFHQPATRNCGHAAPASVDAVSACQIVQTCSPTQPEPDLRADKSLQTDCFAYCQGYPRPSSEASQ